MAPNPRRSALAVAVFLAACAGGGALVERTVGAQASADESTLRNDLHSFTTVYSRVERNYAEPLNGDKAERAIYDGAIPGMLRVLDPHSSFYDPKAFAKQREDQHGKYYGVGMTIQPQNNKIVVLFPYEGTPSFKAGLRPADVIVSVDGKSTDSMDTTEVANMLKGPKGTHVHVTVTRFGQSKPMTFDLVRDEIPHGSIDLEFLVRPGVGYIHITQFQETTGREVSDALDNFGPIKGLVLDLRSNPGGLLTERGVRQVPEEGSGHRLPARPRLPGAGATRLAREWRTQLPHRHTGEPRDGFCFRDRQRRPAGPRPGAGSRRNHLR